LQWGHAGCGVEEAPAPRPGRRSTGRFNGATPVAAWKRSRIRPTSVGWGCFNGATPAMVWETGSGIRPASTGRLLQWGHAPGRGEGSLIDLGPAVNRERRRFHLVTESKGKCGEPRSLAGEPIPEGRSPGPGPSAGIGLAHRSLAQGPQG